MFEHRVELLPFAIVERLTYLFTYLLTWLLACLRTV